MATHWAPLREPAFRRFLLVRLTADFAVQIQTVAVGWTVYDRTRDPFDLGLVGLSQFLPALVLFLVTGSVADRFRRSRIIGVCLAVEAICAGAFLAFMLTGSIEVWGILLVMACFGTARAFYVPAQQALLPNIVPAGEFAGAVATITGVAKFATIAGPMAGGLLYALAPSAAFAAGVVLLVGASALAVSIRQARPAQASHGLSWSELLAGFRYIGSQKVVFGAVTLDLCAVLLGGATALMPVYARDILDVGPAGLGLLNASPAIGGVAVALYLSFRPIRSRVGHVLFATVALFGLATIVFGVSRALELSVVALIVMGAADMISVNVRHTLVQLQTPDPLRGRVAAVNAVSIGASNEIGQFRAGVMAALIGTVPAVVAGGAATLAVVALWSRLFPQLYSAQRFERSP